jgi:GntR family transcriptional regulator/MocR family aminotransferase
MARWSVALELGSEDLPLFRKIAAAIAGDIERGRLHAGARLGSSRALALALGVSRSTVVAAYDELCSRGWIEIEATRGAFVVGVPAEARGRRDEPPIGAHAGFDLPDALPLDLPAPRDAHTLLLLGGVPELRDLPYRALARAYRAALLGRSAHRLIDYADPQGDRRLREAIGELMTHARGVSAPLDAITTVRGSKHGLYLAARTLLRPGDVVAVEQLGYRPAWQALELAGAALAPVPVDRDGLDVDALAAMCARRPVRAVYVTPHRQVPTTVTLAATRRAQLLALARAHRMIILEDDHDFEFTYEGRPTLPLAATDRAGVVVYVGSLSKLLAPGLRLGYVVASPEVSRRIAAYRSVSDGQGDHALERAVALLLEDGEVQRHVRRTLRSYRARREVLCRALRQRLPALEFDVPSGGMALWVRLPGGDTAAWARRGLAHGVAFQPGSRFSFDDEPRELARVGFATCSEPELIEAVERMVRALPDSAGSSPARDHQTRATRSPARPASSVA